jgi:hypothetical protein
VTRSGPAVGDILDDAAEVVSTVALPWAGLLWLTSVPLRLGQAHFAARVMELGPEAHAYGDHLQGLALAVALAFLLSLWGRAVFVRACFLRLRTLEPTGLGPLRLGLGSFVTYVYVALALEAASYATCLSLVAIPLFALLAGLAAATLPLLEKPGLFRPFNLIASSARQASPLVGLLLAFGAAFVLAAVNLAVLFRVGLWLADGIVGLDLTRWDGLLGPGNRRFLLVLAAGGWLVVEPWWLAALVVYVHKTRARASGEDLRLWFDRLRKVAA